MTTLEEAIAHHRWAAGNCVGEVSDEHSQMVGWLEELVQLKAENAKLRELLSSALIVAGFSGRQFLDTYLREEKKTTLFNELKTVGIEVEDE